MYPNTLYTPPTVRTTLLALALTFSTPTWAAVDATTLVGDVSDRSAVIWSRAEGETTLNLLLFGAPALPIKKQQMLTADHDYAAHFEVNRLRPDTIYFYAVWAGEVPLSAAVEEAVVGHFRTAPSPQSVKPVRFAWGGDLGGQNVCRDAADDYPIFHGIKRFEPDFFIGLGDMIYADGVCEETGRYGNIQLPGDFTQSADLENFWKHWHYNWAAPGLRDLLDETPYIAIWDDHEVVNDFGPLHDTRDTPPYTAGEHLLPLGLQAFFDYNPIAVANNTPKRLYRNLRWGQQLELFILDTRQYRDPNFEADSTEAIKSALGREQLTWLKKVLAASDATWKVIISSVPISIPTGSSGAAGRDGWADFTESGGFENELREILEFLRDNDIHNNLWITTDVHFASVFRYTPFGDSPDFTAHEAVVGPLNAGLFPKDEFDTTFNPERLFFFGPESADAVTSYEDALDWFNFGAVEIDPNGVLTLTVRDVEGQPVYTTAIPPTP